jgi:hypothetical protein
VRIILTEKERINIEVILLVKGVLSESVSEWLLLNASTAIFSYIMARTS